MSKAMAKVIGEIQEAINNYDDGLFHEIEALNSIITKAYDRRQELIEEAQRVLEMAGVKCLPEPRKGEFTVTWSNIENAGDELSEEITVTLDDKSFSDVIQEVYNEAKKGMVTAVKGEYVITDISFSDFISTLVAK